MTNDLIIKHYAMLKGGEIWEAYYNALLQRKDIPDYEIEQMRRYISDLRECNIEILLHVKVE
jgi:hypothetical protein